MQPHRRATNNRRTAAPIHHHHSHRVPKPFWLCETSCTVLTVCTVSTVCTFCTFCAACAVFSGCSTQQRLDKRYYSFRQECFLKQSAGTREPY